MPIVPSELIEVRRISGKGRGVFARQLIPAGMVIEIAPVLVVPEDDMETTELAGHCFLWSEGKVGLPLGYGALYNHSYDPNAEYLDRTPQTKVYRAVRDIAAGEEITINYNGTPNDRSPVGFDVRE
jgi:SET domain-containing protein